MIQLARGYNSFSSWFYASGRRWFTKNPTNRTADAHVAWLQEQVKAYATPRPYTGPLTSSGDNLTGETWEMREGYRRMILKEPSVKAAILTKCLAVAQLEPSVQPADPADKLSRASAKWLKYSVARSIGGWPKLIWNILFHGVMDGFSINEKVFDTIDIHANQYAGFWTLKGVKAKDSKGVRFRLDVFKNIVAVQSMVAAQGGANFNPDEFLIFTHLKVFESPFGVSDLRAANRAANLIEAAIKLRAILLENFSGPFLKGTASDAGTRLKMMSVLRDARARGWIVLPEGADIEVINLATSAPDQFQNSIEDLRQEIVTAIQGAYLQLLEGGISDGRGNTQVHKGVAELFQWWLAVCVSEVINHSLVPDLHVPNYGRSVAPPIVGLGGVNSAAVVQDLGRFKAGQDLGITLSKSQVTEVGGFDSPDDAEDSLPPPSNQPGGGSGGGSGGFGGLANIFGPDAGSTDQGDQSPDQPPDAADSVSFGDATDGGHVVPFDAARFAELPGSTFRAFDPLTRKFADWKPYTDPKSDRTGWISAGGQVRYKDPRPAEAKKTQARSAAETNVMDAVTNPAKLEPQHVAQLRDHLATMTRDKIRELAKGLSLKAGGLKVHLAERLVAAATGQKQPAFDYGRKAPKDTLTAVVKRYGGIDPNSHALKTHVSGMKEAIEYGINLGVFRKGGRGLDQMAKELHAAGHLASPDDEHLFEQLKAGALSLHADARKEYEAAEAAYWQAQQEAEEYAKRNSANRSRVEKAIRGGESAGRSAAAGDPIPDAGGQARGNSGGDNTDFDFGFNVSGQGDVRPGKGRKK